MKINATSCPPLKLSHQQLIRACMEVLESQNECKGSSRVENSKLFQSQNFANVWIVLKLKLSIFVSLIKHRRIFNSTAVRERRRDTYVKWCLNCLITVTMYDTMKRTVVIRWIIWSVRMYDITNWEFLVFIAYMHNYELISEREHAWEWKRSRNNVFAPGLTLQTRFKNFTQIRKNSWTFWEFLHEISYLQLIGFVSGDSSMKAIRQYSQ